MTDSTAARIDADDLDPRSVGLLVEAKLREWGITYEYVPDFPLADVKSVDWTQVREDVHREDKESLAEFRTHMAQGAVFPPIVLMDDVLVDGNHRVGAAKGLRRKTIPAFRAQFNSVDLAKTFAAALNQQNGRRLTPAEAQEAALTMLRRGMADEAVAREIGRSVEYVRQQRHRKNYAERAARNPELAQLADQVTKTNQIKLAQIAHDPAFVEAVKLVAETRPKASDVNGIVKTVGQARNDHDAVEAVRSLRGELAPAGPPPVKVTVTPELRQARPAIGMLVKLAGNPTALLDLPNRDRSREDWATILELAGKMVELYDGQGNG